MEKTKKNQKTNKNLRLESIRPVIQVSWLLQISTEFQSRGGFRLFAK